MAYANININITKPAEVNSDMPSSSCLAFPLPLARESIRLGPVWGRDGWLWESETFARASFSAVASMARLTTLPFESGVLSLRPAGVGAGEETVITGGFPAEAGGRLEPCCCWAIVQDSEVVVARSKEREKRLRSVKQACSLDERTAEGEDAQRRHTHAQ